MYAIVPFCLLVIIDSIIIYKARHYSNVQVLCLSNAQQRKSNKRQNRISRSILIITFFYVCINLPPAVVTGFFYDQVVSGDLGPMIVNLMDNITFSFPALEFLFLLYSNKTYRKELKNCFFLDVVAIIDINYLSHRFKKKYLSIIFLKGG